MTDDPQSASAEEPTPAPEPKSSPFPLPPRERDDRATTDAGDPDESPFELPAIAGLPFGKESEEARAIEQVIREADRERAGKKPATA